MNVALLHALQHVDWLGLRVENERRMLGGEEMRVVGPFLLMKVGFSRGDLGH